MPGIYNEQKIYDALSNSSKEKGNESSIFDTEYSRKYYLERISTQDLTDAITKLERDDYAGVSLRSEMITTMKKALSVKTGTAVKTTDLKSTTGPVIAKPVPTATSSTDTGAVVAKPIIKNNIAEDASLKANQESFRTMTYTVEGKSATFKWFDRINWRDELTLKLESTNQTFYLMKNISGKWETISPTADDYTIQIDTDTKKMAITVKNTSWNSKSDEKHNTDTTTKAQKSTIDTPSQASTATPKSAPAKKVRTDIEVTSGNTAYIAKNKAAIDSAIEKITDTTKKTAMLSYIADPTSANIHLLQKEVKATEDGDFRGGTLAALTWVKVAAPAAAPAAAPGVSKDLPRVEDMKKVTITNLGDAFKDLSIYTDPTDSVKTYYIKVPHTEKAGGKAFSYIGIPSTDVETNTIRVARWLMIGGKEYNITLTPDGKNITASAEEIVASPAAAPGAVPVTPVKPKEWTDKVSWTITFPKDFTPDNKKIIETEFAGLMDLSKISFVWAPAGTKIDKIEAYEVGVSIYIGGMLGWIKFEYDKNTTTTEDKSMILNGEAYNTEVDRKTGVIKMAKTLSDPEMKAWKDAYPGFFPLSRIKLTGTPPSGPKDGIKDFTLSKEDLTIFGDYTGHALTLPLDYDGKPFVVNYDHLPYTITVDKKLWTIDFKKVLSDDVSKKLLTDFGLDGTEEDIPVVDNRNVGKDAKFSTTTFSLGADGKTVILGGIVTLVAGDVGKAWLSLTKYGRGTTIHYDKAKKTLTLGDTPRQKIIDEMRANPALKIISPDAKNPANIVVSLDGKTDLGSFSTKQAALIGRYHGMITAHNMYEKSETKIKLVASMDTNGNLILTHKTIDPNSSQVFQVIVTSDGQVGTIVKRWGNLQGSLQSARDLFGIKTNPIPSQQALIDEIKTYISTK